MVSADPKGVSRGEGGKVRRLSRVGEEVSRPSQRRHQQSQVKDTLTPAVLGQLASLNGENHVLT